MIYFPWTCWILEFLLVLFRRLKFTMRGKAGRSLAADPLGGGPLPALSPFDRTTDLIAYQFFGTELWFCSLCPLAGSTHWSEYTFFPKQSLG